MGRHHHGACPGPSTLGTSPRRDGLFRSSRFFLSSWCPLSLTIRRRLLQWGTAILDSVPYSMRATIDEPLALLRSALVEDLPSAYKQPIAPLVPRPAIFLISYIASSLYLLQHAVWSYTRREVEREVDTDAFRRWVIEGGLKIVQDEVKRAQVAATERVRFDSALVYGCATRPKL